MKMKTRRSKTYGMQQKQFWEGSLQQYNTTSIKKKKLKQSNLTPKGTRERRTNKTQR